jgi:adhesin HecA-like repeat protein
MKNLLITTRWVLGAVTIVVYGLIQAAGGIDAAGDLLLKAMAI